MNERRVDPFTGRSVLIAPSRRGIGATRPSGLPSPGARCPFCPEHEADAEPTLARWPAEGLWRVRVVRNKYPVIDASFPDALGSHEVVIDAREHDADLADLSVEQLRGLLHIYRERVRALETRDDIAAVLLFRNRGRRAGSSQPHPHTQVAALSWIPAEVALRWERARRHLEEHGEPLHVAELRRELGSERVLEQDDDLLSYCPWAPSRAYEVRFTPRREEGAFGSVSDATLDALANHLGRTTRSLRVNTSIRDMNLVLRQPPAGSEGAAASWHLELLPRTGGDAGFELTSGEMVVVVSPREAARRLRGEL